MADRNGIVEDVVPVGLERDIIERLAVVLPEGNPEARGLSPLSHATRPFVTGGPDCVVEPLVFAHLPKLGSSIAGSLLPRRSLSERGKGIEYAG